MFFIALATDYDGTLAELGMVKAETIEALEKFKETGRKLILVTGRELEDLKTVFAELKIFDRIVAENGALLYNPATQESRVLCEPPSQAFVKALKDRDVNPLSVGHAIVATWEPNEKNVLEAIQELGLELQITFNKGAVMVLPAGVNKATGLMAALKDLSLSPHNVVAVGDAENDHAFLKACGCAVAVANALPMVKETADFTTTGDRGAGVAELMARVIAEDGSIVTPQRHGIELGTDEDNIHTYLGAHLGSVLIAGQSGIGKSTIATALTERMAEKGFQFCVFDPEGDYQQLENSVCVGDAKVPPGGDEVVDLVKKLETNVVVCTLAIAHPQRPTFFAELFPRIATFRIQSGRPHWMIVDEAHHLFPAALEGLEQIFPSDLPATILITVHPEAVSTHALKTVHTVIAVGEKAPDVIRQFCKAVGTAEPPDLEPPGEDEVLFWRRESLSAPLKVKVKSPKQERKRHTRKYAEGELGPDRSFYFRGPKRALNLRAQNLMLFLQIADGVDDATWEHHLRAHDYSNWLRTAIKNDDLAEEVERFERDASLAARDSRKRVSEAILRHYTVPAHGTAEA